MKKSGPVAAYFFEPAMRPQLPFFKTMIRAKNPLFMRRTIESIIYWDNQAYPSNILHIHGSKDHTLSARRIKNAVILPGASHWAIYLNADVISPLIIEALKKS